VRTYSTSQALLLVLLLLVLLVKQASGVFSSPRRAENKLLNP